MISHWFSPSRLSLEGNLTGRKKTKLGCKCCRFCSLLSSWQHELLVYFCVLSFESDFEVGLTDNGKQKKGKAADSSVCPK